MRQELGRDGGALDIYASPLRPAVCALAAAGAGFDAMAALSVGSYDQASGVVTSPGTDEEGPVSLSVPGPARVYVAAQQDLRRLNGATDDAPLLIAREGSLRARTLSTIVKNVRRETGAAVAASRADRVLLEPDRFSRRLGITVRVMP